MSIFLFDDGAIGWLVLGIVFAGIFDDDDVERLDEVFFTGGSKLVGVVPADLCVDSVGLERSLSRYLLNVIRKRY